jgi:signal peptidase I
MTDTQRKGGNHLKHIKGQGETRVKSGPGRNVLKIVKNILVWLVVAAAVSMMIFTVISAVTFDRNDRDLFGFKAFIVRSDSMSATDFKAGDLILVKEVDPATLQAGDIIAFLSQDSDSFGEVVTHKIRGLTTDSGGAPGFITYGTTTDTNDEALVTYEYVLGKYQKAIPGVGSFFSFLKTTPGYIVCIFLPFLLLIIIQGVNSVRLFKRYKEEQLAEMNAVQERQRAEMAEERERLEAERAETKKVMEQLQQLKSEMSGYKAEGKPSAGTEIHQDADGG